MIMLNARWPGFWLVLSGMFFVTTLATGMTVNGGTAAWPAWFLIPTMICLGVGLWRMCREDDGW